jgi:hypothetical protein
MTSESTPIAPTVVYIKVRLRPVPRARRLRPSPKPPAHPRLRTNAPPPVDYASKAVESAGCVVGLKCKDGVVMGVEKIIKSKLLVEGSNKRCARRP